jgi:hypothetical protein
MMLESRIVPSWGTFHADNTIQLKALWNGRLGHQMKGLPQFDEVFRTVRRKLRQADFPK